MQTTSNKNGREEKEVTGSCVTENPPTSLENTISFATITQSIQNLDTLISGIQTESGSTFGKHARLMTGVMACAILKTDGVDSHTWQRRWRLTQLPKRKELISASYLKQGQMLNSYSRKRLSDAATSYPSTLSHYRPGWTNRRQNSCMRFLR